jgi:uncharacterized oligopeptide transporter (OPT) family protein
MIPLRRHMIVHQNLPFPSGTATAVLIDEMWLRRLAHFRTHNARARARAHTHTSTHARTNTHKRTSAHTRTHTHTRYKAKDEGASKARLLLLTLAAAFCYVVLSYFAPVLYSVPLFYWAGLPAAQAAGFFLNASPAMLGAGFFSGTANARART